MSFEGSTGQATAATCSVIRASLPFDLGCAHTLPDSELVGRCQLWAGHDGDHALLFVRQGQRMVRTWSDVPPIVPRDSSDTHGYPWVRGFPYPAWHQR